MTRWEPISLGDSEFDSITKPPSDLGLFYDGQRHALSGAPESLKTVIAYMLILSVVREARATGVTRGYVVALIDFEMGPRRTREMLTFLGVTVDELDQIYYVTPETGPSDDDVQAMIRTGLTFVVVDSVAGAYEVSDLDDGKRLDVQKFVRAWIDPFWREGIGTLQIDHVAKNADSSNRYSINSERKLGRWTFIYAPRWSRASRAAAKAGSRSASPRTARAGSNGRSLRRSRSSPIPTLTRSPGR